ncbi:MAG TPA: beta-Ala-His dipeptidase [Gaiellaceae bacterium]|nr:beta-Ala-His dipeptidase [Gaiellaceae bacterium]
MSGGGVFDRLEPALVWQRFDELTRIPRPSKQEDRARAHVLAWARARDLDTSVDAAGNTVVRVPPSTGREDAPEVVLQAHLDMVCERDAESPYDPREGRIHVVLDGDWVVAEGTTLGADNGIGVAAALAVADDPALDHGPLELLFTVSEEEGLAGAKELDPSLVAGRLLVNLDGTSDEVVTVGCAGSAHTFFRLELSPESAPEHALALRIELSGARGGHSGEDIAGGRVNAIKALGRVLAAAHGAAPLRLVRLDGGTSRNAIPRRAQAAIVANPESGEALRDAALRELNALRDQYADEDGLSLSLEAGEPTDAASDLVTRRALDLLAAIPNGVLALMPGERRVVETSTCLTVATTENGVLTLASMSRSSNPGALEDLAATARAVARLAGANVEVVRSYPPWPPDLDSQLLATARGTFEHLFGRSPHLEVVHGGLECAVIGEKLPEIEMISIGPAIVGLHAPGERLGISSTQRFYRLLGALLDDLAS